MECTERAWNLDFDGAGGDADKEKARRLTGLEFREETATAANAPASHVLYAPLRWRNQYLNVTLGQPEQQHAASQDDNRDHKVIHSCTYNGFVHRNINRFGSVFKQNCRSAARLFSLTRITAKNHRPAIVERHEHPIAVSALVNSLKGVSSRLMRQRHPALVRRYWKGVLWSPSYFAASCGGAPISIIRQYIEQQQTPP